MSTLPSRTVSVRIERAPELVYGFLARPENFPQWASGLGRSLRRDGDGWIADGPDGPVPVRFTPPNRYGIADHAVRLRPDLEVTLPIRVLANGDGSEVLFTLFQTPGMDDATFARDADWVARDLDTLKRLLEGG